MRVRTIEGKAGPIRSYHVDDEDGNPAGGLARMPGVEISWQNGPLGRGADRRGPNGAFVEDVIAIAIDRINYYQASRFACDENAEALEHLGAALAALDRRTADREARGVEGTHEE
jgi:hypothetical protein